MGMPSINILLDSASPIVTMLLYATTSTGVTVPTVSGLVMLGVSGTMGVVSSVSPLTCACSRDYKLPRPLGHVRQVSNCASTRRDIRNGHLNSPFPSSSQRRQQYLHRIQPHRFPVGPRCFPKLRHCARSDSPCPAQWPWNLSRAGTMINILGFVYTACLMIWLPFPNYLPVKAANMHYCGPFGSL